MANILAVLVLMSCIALTVINALINVAKQAKGIKTHVPFANAFCSILLALVTSLFLYIDRYTLMHAALSMAVIVIMVLLTTKSTKITKR